MLLWPDPLPTVFRRRKSLTPPDRTLAAMLPRSGFPLALFLVALLFAIPHAAAYAAPGSRSSLLACQRLREDALGVDASWIAEDLKEAGGLVETARDRA